MSRGKRGMIIFSITVSLIVTGVLAINVYLTALENQATKVAQEYLVQKYNEEMRYVEIFKSWIDPALYRVRFSPVNNDKIVFEVYVSQNLSIQEDLWKFGESGRSADNYYIRCFEYYMGEYLLPEVKQLWGDNATVKVLDNTNMGGPVFLVSSMLNNEMSATEMEPLVIDYRIVIGTNDKLDEDSLVPIAEQILEFFQVIKDNIFTPKLIAFYFPEIENEAQRVEFENWQEIVSVDQVIEQLKAEIEDS